ncbi:class II fructose-bisphosphate aldolase [Streptomyces fuscigenes]|uniref:class II fructose-bisphosphate aldolase n=1 Tax=Streptomyces fuscigenes TaxID=1528880 RepID=UPI001F29E2DA|nr:class II fructose-bisphosphate aldolase [Streptomyces fuscigenes]MCF3961439.1 class II fructose-bisphosphate aldolase family protein [Streptomyces fuscigenes]
MSLVSTRDLVAEAAAGRRAVAAFNVITLEYAEAITEGAAAAGVPVILQISENAVRFHGGRVEPIARAAAEAARAGGTGVALHLDHVTDMELLRRAADAGFSSAMFDAGAQPYAENLAATRAAAEWAHGAGLWLEAELGYVGGKPDAPASAHAAGVRTDPEEAARYVADTGVDALAVAVGSSHAMTERSAALDHDLIARLREAVPVPLVLHGSSGVADDELRRAVAAGIAKVNIGTALGIAFTGAVREVLADRPETVDPRHFLTRGREAVSAVVRQLCTTLDG